MIRKISIVVAVLAVLGFVAVLFLKREVGPTDAAALVPSESIAFINLVDLPRTAVRWRGTALAKIGNEPEMKAFLERPLGRFQADPGANEAGSLLAGLKPGNIFVAMTSLSQDSARVLIGFQFWGGRADFDQAVARLRKQIVGSEVPTTTEMHNNIAVAVSGGGADRVYSAAHGRWGFVANDGELIREALDRTVGTRKDNALAESETFRKVMSRLPDSPDVRFFLQPKPAVDTLLEIGRSLGAQAIPAQLAELRSTEAVGGIWKLDGDVQRDAIFVVRPGSEAPPNNSHAALSLTTPATVFFGDLVMRDAAIAQIVEAAQPWLSQSPEAAELARLAVEAFGPGAGVAVQWASGQNVPAGVAAVQVRDASKARTFLDRSTPLVPGATAFEDRGATIYSFPFGANPLTSPTLALNDRLLVIGLDPASVTGAIHAQSGGETLESTPAFREVSDTFREANEVFAYIDSKVLFERAYTTLRPVIIFSASLLPDVAANIDTTKLPQTETITRHLSPIVFSQRVTSDGTLIESSGPITFNQALLAATVAGGGFGPKIFGR